MKRLCRRGPHRRYTGCGAGEIGDTDGGKGTGYAADIGKSCGDARQTGQGKQALENCDGLPIGKRKPVIGTDHVARIDGERLRLACGRQPLFDMEHPFFGGASRRDQIVMEPHPLPDGIIRRRRRDKGPRAAPRADQTLVDKRRNPVAHRVAIDAKPFRQGPLGRELIPRHITPFGKIGPKRIGDGFPYRSFLGVTQCSQISSVGIGGFWYDMYSCIVIKKVVEMKDTLDENMSRKAWLGLMAKAKTGRVGALLDGAITRPDFTWLRAPEIGSTMVQGRAGATGAPFNLGEMTVTRCALTLATGEVGHAYIQGRNKGDAAAVAMMDALMQTDHAPTLRAQVLDVLAQEQADRRAARAGKAAATKVDFFTMVRGED